MNIKVDIPDTLNRLGNASCGDCEMEGYWIRKLDQNDNSKKIYLKLGDPFLPPDKKDWVFLGETD